MSVHPNEIIRTLFKGIGTAQQSERQRLDRLKRNCMDYKDPNVCYLVLELAGSPKISWRHNTGNHFGTEHEGLSYEGYLSLIHPSWTIPYYMYGQIAYGISARDPKQLRKMGITFTMKVPLLARDGYYYWYDQVVVPGTLDKHGNMVSHLNYYRRLGRYDRLIPGPPMLFAQGRPDTELLPGFRQQGLEIVRPFLKAFFTDERVYFLEKYRALPEVLSGVKPKRGDGAKALDMSVDAYDRVQQRIRKDVLDVTFEGFSANTAHAFAVFLNDFFPKS